MCRRPRRRSTASASRDDRQDVDIRARAKWVRDLLRNAGEAELPLYGSAAWAAAPEPVRVASCVRAAEAWRLESDPHRIAARLEQELEAAQWCAERDYDAWREIAGRVVRIGLGPTHAELVERRAEVVRPSVGGAR